MYLFVLCFISEDIDISREKLWTFLSPQRTNGGMQSWKQSYQDFLNNEGVGEEMQTKALLLQLWTTQVEATFLYSMCLCKTL